MITVNNKMYSKTEIAQLREAFDELAAKRTGCDIGRMAEAIGGARFVIASTLEKLGDPEPMREILANIKSWNESLSNSAAPIESCAAKESARTAEPSSGGERGERLASLLDASPSEFESLFAQALTSHERY